VSPRTRGRILREILKGRDVQATGRGIEMHFTLSSQPTLDDKRIEWRARIRRHWYRGKAGSVFDALQEIEREADKPR
jgi:hypothetical protein